MPIKYTINWNKEFYDDIIDVRSPKEFAKDHIPYSKNFPVLNDNEREIIGAIYKKESPFKARKLGASLISKNISKILKKNLYEKSGNWKPLLYCWRGGQRSKSLAIVLSEIGWQIRVLKGGYNTYRKKVLTNINTLVNKNKYIVVSGQTGCGKSEILKYLGKLGVNIIDLETLASHKGSLLGKMHDKPQPSQRMFESILYKDLCKLKSRKKVFIEHESSKIGNLHLPSSILNKIKISPKINVAASLDSRILFLIKDYKKFIKQDNSFEELFNYAEKKKGKRKVNEWRTLYKQKNWKELAKQLIEKYYDPLYTHKRINTKNTFIKEYCPRKLTNNEFKLLSYAIKKDFE